jgi:hypothetical protein
MKSIETLIEEAIDNVRTDRAAASSLLVDAMIYAKKNEEHHKTVGFVIAKYLETLQRSNEQLVRLTSIIGKSSGGKISLSEEDKEELYDAIKE